MGTEGNAELLKHEVACMGLMALYSTLQILESDDMGNIKTNRSFPLLPARHPKATSNSSTPYYWGSLRVLTAHLTTYIAAHIGNFILHVPITDILTHARKFPVY